MKDSLKKFIIIPILLLRTQIRIFLSRATRFAIRTSPFPAVTKHIIASHKASVCLTPTEKKNILRLQNSAHGKTALIVGSGPSAKNSNLSEITADATFFMNKSYLLDYKVTTPEKYLVIANPYAYMEYGNRLDLSSYHALFLLKDICGVVKRKPEGKKIFFFSKWHHPKAYDGFIQKSLTEPLYESHTVALFACQLALAMGFQNIILSGIDLEIPNGQQHFYQSSDNEQKRAETAFRVNLALMREGLSVFKRKATDNGISVKVMTPGRE